MQLPIFKPFHPMIDLCFIFNPTYILHFFWSVPRVALRFLKIAVRKLCSALSVIRNSFDENDTGSQKSLISSDSVLSIRHISKYAPALGEYAYENANHPLYCDIIANDYDIRGDSYNNFVTTSCKKRTKTARYDSFLSPFMPLMGDFHTRLHADLALRVAFLIFLNK